MPVFTSDNTNMHYLDQGQGDTVVLLHGLGSCASDWAAQLNVLSGNYRVIAPDFRGHGSSSAAKAPFSMRQLAEDVKALLLYLNVKQCQVVGFSLGGMVAFELALIAAPMLQSLVIINSTPHMLVGTWRLKSQLWFRLAIIRLLGMRRLGSIIGKKLFPQPEQAALIRQFAAQMAVMDQRSYRWTLSAIAKFSVQTELARLNLPILVIAADQDYSPVEDKRAYTELLPNATLVVIKNSRHATPLDQPQMLNQQLLSFLASVVETGQSNNSNVEISGGEHHV